MDETLEFISSVFFLVNMLKFLKWAKYGAVVASLVCVAYVVDEF